jgi:hypothetical protein
MDSSPAKARLAIFAGLAGKGRSLIYDVSESELQGVKLFRSLKAYIGRDDILPGHVI